MLLTVLWAAAQGEPVQRTLGQILLQIGEYAAALVAVSGLVWWLVWPRIKGGIERIVTQVSETHRSVTVNHHSSPEPTMRDDLSDVKQQIADVAQQLVQVTAVSAATSQRASDLGDMVSGLSDRVADVHDIAKDTKEAFDEHEKNGARYLGEVRVVLGRSGIELPPAKE